MPRTTGSATAATPTATLALSSAQSQTARDELVPPDQAVGLQRLLATRCRELLMIPGAGHNDLLWVGRTAYFQAIDRFASGL